MTPNTRPRRKSPVDHDPEALVWARKAAGWRQARLAREVGMSPSALCEAEKGTRGIAPDKLNQLARILNCPVSILQRSRVSL